MERTITIEDLNEALTIIRDDVLTDENINTFFGVLSKMRDSLVEIYFAASELFSSNKEETLEDLASRGFEKDSKQLFAIIENEDFNDTPFEHVKKYLTSETSSRKIKITSEGLIEALEFISTHVKTTGNILDDLQRLFVALSKVQLFQKEDEETEPNNRAIVKFPEKTEDLYTKLIESKIL